MDNRDTAYLNKMHFWELTWPIWVEMFLTLIMGNSDTIMLSFVSDQAVAAVALANQYIMLSLMLLQVIAVGTQVVLSQYFGAQKWQDCERIIMASLILNVLIGGLISLVLVICRVPFLELFHIAPSLLSDGEAYLKIVGGFLFVQALVNGISGILKIYGHVREAMVVSIGMNILHIGANGVLIFGLPHFPALGVDGAAWATSLSRIGAALVLCYVLVRLNLIRVHWKHVCSLHIADIGKMLKIGVPAALENFTYQAVQTVFLALISTLGTEAIAARQYVVNITLFITLFGSALSFANSILVGKLTGAGQYQMAYEQTKKSIKWSFITVILVTGLVIICRVPLLHLFTQNPEVIRWGSLLLLLNLLVETGRVMNMNLVSALNAAGDAKFPVWMGLIFMVGLSLPTGYGLTLYWGMGLAGIWIATGLDEWLRGMANLYRWNSRKWEAYTIVHQTKNHRSPF
jgi:putative MATE family efflux protein